MASTQQQQSIPSSDFDIVTESFQDRYAASTQPEPGSLDDGAAHRTDVFMTAVAGGDLGDETTIRLLKAKVRVMQEEINALQSDLQMKDTAIADLQSR